MKHEDRENVRRRLKTVAGHVCGILRMIDEDRYCVDVIRQIDAVEQALQRAKAQLLAGHLDSCVTTAIRSGKPAVRERVIRELLEIYEAEPGLKRPADGRSRRVSRKD